MFRFSPTITFEEWRKAFILACQKLGVKAIPALPLTLAGIRPRLPA